MGVNHQVFQCNCPGCRRHRRNQILKQVFLYTSMTLCIAAAIGVWTYHNALEFAKLHEPYTIGVFP